MSANNDLVSLRVSGGVVLGCVVVGQTLPALKSGLLPRVRVAPNRAVRGPRSNGPGLLADGMDTLPARKGEGGRERDAALGINPGLVCLNLAEGTQLPFNPLHFVNRVTVAAGKLVTSLGLGLSNLMILDARSIEAVEKAPHGALRVGYCALSRALTLFGQSNQFF
jgi:hypothetical protein